MPMLIINEKEQKKPVFTVKTVTANGTYNAFEDNADGYSSVIVDTPVKTLTTKNISSNGTYNASSDNADGYSEVTVDVEPNVGTKNISANGTYNASSDNLDGYSSVTVDVQPTLISKSITSNGNYSASADNADGYSSVSVNVPLPSNAYLLQSIEHESIATFADGTDNYLKSLEVAIEPQQDLHGYDAPWVGGAGKNKFDGTAILDNKWINANGEVESQYGFWTSDYIPVKQGDVVRRTATGSARGAFSDINKENGVYSSGTELTASQDGYYRFCGDKSTILPTGQVVCTINNTDLTFTPYSNICPISGWTDCKVTVADDLENPTVSNVYTIDLDGTRYGGTLDVVSGTLVVTHGYIASYNGETLPSTWISDRDVYAEGTTPTTGAEVCYKLATPQTIQLTPTIIKSLQGANNFFASTGEIEWMQYWGKETA